MQANFANIRRIFEDIVDRPADQWDSILDSACASDGELRRQVAQLLKCHVDSNGILDRDAAEKILIDVAPPLAERPGSLIGPYKLIEQIGEGGFGIVFMAEQREP